MASATFARFQICIQTQGATCPDECEAAGDEGIAALTAMVLEIPGPASTTALRPRDPRRQHPCFADSEAGSKTAEQFWPVSRQICESDTYAGAAAATAAAAAAAAASAL